MASPAHAHDVTDILSFIQAGEALGVRLPSHLRDKLDAVAAVGSGKLRVALVGGFSEGKTSLAAAWLGKLPEDMKISQSESSDAVTVYEANDGIELIDTPGLFGFKEAVSAEGAVERYKDLTRRYVSEADIVLYVLNPSNPLKESHREELHWLFRELALLARTVMVIGRFDMIADLEDDADYEHNLEIKKAGIRARLRDLIGLSDEEAGSLAVVGVAANPFDEGIASWLDRPEEYERLSRLGELREATTSRLQALGGSEEVRRQTCLTVLRDVSDHLLPAARLAVEETERQAAIADGAAREEQPRLDRYRREAGEAQIALRREVVDYFGDLIAEAETTDRGHFAEFFDRKIGDDGIVVRSMMMNAFTRELGSMSSQIIEMSVSFAAGNSEGGVITSTLGKAAKRFGAGLKIESSALLKARDWVLPTFKFKPYGAIKSARIANRAVAGLGIAMELGSMAREAWQAKQFEAQRKAIVDDLKAQRANLIEQIDNPAFISTHFPQLAEMQKLFEMLAAAFAAAAERSQMVHGWAAQAETLHARFLAAPATSAIPRAIAHRQAQDSLITARR